MAEPYQERVLEEEKELRERWQKLRVFLSTLTFQGLVEKEREALMEQMQAMDAYHAALAKRINIWIERGDLIEFENTLTSSKD